LIEDIIDLCDNYRCKIYSKIYLFWLYLTKMIGLFMKLMNSVLKKSLSFVDFWKWIEHLLWFFHLYWIDFRSRIWWTIDIRGRCYYFII